MTSPPDSAAVPSVADPSRPASAGGAPYFSRAGLVEGAVAMLPVVLNLFATGIVFGTLASQKSLTLV